jgi:hypothetical protein
MGKKSEASGKEATRRLSIADAAQALLDEVERRFGLLYVDTITVNHNQIVVRFCDSSDAVLCRWR